MGGKLGRWIPRTLKNRLFAAFILLILLPSSLLMVNYFSNIESVLRQTFSDQSLEQMVQINQSFDEMISKAHQTSVLLNQDSQVKQVLLAPERFNAIERVNMIEEKFRAINNSLFLTTPQIYYTIADLYGNVYSSYMPSQPFSRTFLNDSPLFRESLSSAQPYTLNVEPNYVQPEFTRSPELLSLHIPMLNDRYKPYAVIRISMDYLKWFQSLTSESPAGYSYALVRKDGVLGIRTEGDPVAASFSVLAAAGDRKGHYEQDGYFYNYSFLPSTGWYLVKRVPTDIVFFKVKELKRSFFVTFLLFTAAFIVITLLISSAVTKPLKHFQRHMANIAESNLKIYIPEKQNTGEVLQLTRSFNRMVGDIHELIQRLKLEERKKEAVHFRMLHSQTNPHFLLNTLNTVKWIAMKDNNQDIVEICVALGKLLEAGLNSEKELIHLRDEIDLVNSYLHIQRFRYKKQYEIQFDYDPSLSYALVPKLSLQPLVDNAIVHGFAGRQSGMIRISIRSDGSMLTVLVEDNGIGPDAAKQSYKPARSGREGIGLNNLKERLELLFKDRASLELLPTDQGTLVQFRMPLLDSTPYGKDERD